MVMTAAAFYARHAARRRRADSSDWHGRPLAAAAPAGFAGLDSDIKGVLVNWPVAFPALQDYAVACIAGGIPKSAAFAASQADFALPSRHPGRPRISPEIRDLIGRMSRANPLWVRRASTG